VRFEGVAKEKSRSISASIRNAAHVVQPPVDIEVTDVEIPSTETVLFVVEIRPGQRGPFQYDGRYVQRIGDGIKAMPHTSVVHAVQAGQAVRYNGAQRLDIPSLSGGPIDRWHYGVMLSPSYDTGRALYNPFSSETREIMEWLNKNGYLPQKRVSKLRAKHAAAWSLELWPLGHVAIVGFFLDKLLPFTPVEHLVITFGRAIRDAAACLKIIEPMLMVDVAIRVWTAQGREPFMLEWRDEHDQVMRLGLKGDTLPIDNPFHRVADLVGERDANTPETDEIAALAVEHMKLVVADQNDVPDRP
jgi:hypothetical protein